MNVYRFVAAIVSLMAPLSVSAGSFADLTEARKVSDKAAILLKQEKLIEGYGTLKPYWPLPAVEIDNLANQTNTQWPVVKQRFGKSLAIEFVKESQVGQSLARYVYLQKFERHAIRWTFTFYKPNDRWYVNSVSFDDNIGLLFD